LSFAKPSQAFAVFTYDAVTALATVTVNSKTESKIVHPFESDGSWPGAGVRIGGSNTAFALHDMRSYAGRLPAEQQLAGDTFHHFPLDSGLCFATQERCQRSPSLQGKNSDLLLSPRVSASQKVAEPDHFEWGLWTQNVTGHLRGKLRRLWLLRHRSRRRARERGGLDRRHRRPGRRRDRADPQHPGR
jgi:hypothetical protein